MWDQNKSDQIKSLINSVNSILVVVGEKPSYDELASAASLYLGLSDLNKNVLLLSPNKIEAKFSNIIGAKHFKQELGNQNLVVGLNYKPESVDKVSYHIGEESKKFYLTIKPKKGFPPLDKSEVEYFYSGAEADLVFLVGVHQYDALDSLYYGFESLYEGATVVTIHKFEPDIGNIKIDVSDFVCMAEATMVLMEEIDVKISADMATNILSALDYYSKGFSSLKVTADTFEIAADLLKLGAIRKKVDFKEEDEIIINKNKEDKKGISKSRRFHPENDKKKTDKLAKKNKNKILSPSKTNQESLIKPGSLHYKPSGALK